MGYISQNHIPSRQSSTVFLWLVGETDPPHAISVILRRFSEATRKSRPRTTRSQNNGVVFMIVETHNRGSALFNHFWQCQTAIGAADRSVLLIASARIVTTPI